MKRAQYIMVAIGVIIAVSVLVNITNTYNAKARLEHELSDARATIQSKDGDIDTLNARIIAAGEKIKARQDENERLQRDNDESRQAMEKVLRQNRDWAGAGVPTPVADWLRSTGSAHKN